MGQAKKKNKDSKLKAYLLGLSLRERVLLFISVFIFGFIIIDFIIIKPVVQKKNNLQNQIATLNIQKAEVLSSNQKNNQLINEYNIAQGKYTSLINEFKNSTTQSNIVKNLIQFAGNDRINIENISFEQGQIDPNYKEIVTNSGVITVKGTYDDVVKYVRDVQDNNFGVKIMGVTITGNTMNLNGTTPAKGKEQYDATININYYNLAKE